MPHIHSVYNTDEHFTIDPVTRTITQKSGKSKLMQYDHNSERYEFDIPRYIDGHDMSLCNSVKINYINVASDRSGQSQGPYEVKDLQLSPNDENVVVLSWLISRNATKHAGTLNFNISFKCLTGSVIDYAWHTDIFKGITVSSGILNDGDEVVEDYTDILEQWKNEIFEEVDGTVKSVNGVTPDASGNVVVSGLPEGASAHQQLVTDVNGAAKWVDRTHYSVSNYKRLKTIKEEAVIDFTLGYTTENAYVMGAYPLDFSDCTDGDMAEVVIDGVSYYAPIRSQSEKHSSALGIGNSYLHNTNNENTGEVLYLGVYPNDQADLDRNIFETGEHTVAAYKVEQTKVVQTLDDIYLPTTVPVIQSASIGQTVVVKTVDENGKPTEWEAADITPSDSEVIDMMIELDALPAVMDADGAILAEADDTILMM